MNKTSQKIDIYLLVLLLDLFCISSFMFFNLGKNTMIDFVMLGLVFMVIIIAYLKNIIWGLLISAFVIFFYASSVIYNSVIFGKEVNVNTYVWMLSIPLSAFISGRLSSNVNLVQTINSNLQKQCRELITIDKTTGLTNVKGFYMDLDREMSKAKRHKINLSLMIIKINYYQELKRFLGESKMKELMKNISNCINISTRMEDIRYKLNEDTLAILMTETDVKGAEVVKFRIKEHIKDLNLKVKEQGKNINIYLKIGILQYNDEIKDSFEFKLLTEKELEYDV